MRKYVCMAMGGIDQAMRTKLQDKIEVYGDGRHRSGHEDKIAE